jgi:hypothetical protein
MPRLYSSHSNNRNFKLALLGAIPVLAIAGAALATTLASAEDVDADYCYDRADQQQVVLSLDNSVLFQMTQPQRRDLENVVRGAFDRLQANGRLSFVSTASDRNGSVVTADYTICRPPATPSEQTSIGAPGQTEPQLKVRLQEARARFEQIADQVLADAIDEQKSAGDSPILSQLQGISRLDEFSSSDRQLIMISDGINNSENARFCTVQGHLPPWDRFKEKQAYDAIRPNSLSGVDVEFYLIEMNALPQSFAPHCTNSEIRKFWPDYFYGNGAKSVEVTLLRVWAGQD